MISMSEQKYTTLKQFLNDQLDTRKMSVRTFGDLVGISHEVITRFRNSDPSDDVGYPSLQTLIRLSEGTGISLNTLIQISYPELRRVDIDIDARLMAEEIAQLSPDDRRIVEKFIRNAKKGE